MSDATPPQVQLDGVNSRPSGASQWMVLTRCAWRINWLGIAFDQKRDFVWMMLSFLAAVLIVALGGASTFVEGYAWNDLAGYMWNDPLDAYRMNKFWIPEVDSRTKDILFFWALCATGAAVRLCRFAQALWLPLPKELGSFSVQYPKLAVFLSPAWFGLMGNAKWAIKALEFAREEGSNKRIAPVQALAAAAVMGLLIILSLEALLLIMGSVTSLVVGVFLLVGLASGSNMLSLHSWWCVAFLLVLAIWARQAVGMGAWIKVKAALGQLRSSRAKTTPVSLASIWTQSKSRWTEALLRQAERDGALSEAESALLEKQTPPGHRASKGAKLRL